MRGDGVRQLLQEVRLIVHIKVVGDGHQLGGVHALDNLVQNVVAKVVQHLTGDFFVYQIPDVAAHMGRRGLQQIGQLRRLERTQQVAPLAKGAGPIGPQDLAEALLEVHLDA